MSEEKKNKKDKKKEKKSGKDNDLDKELRQTFPASDPPSRSRPGHDRSDEDES